MPRRRGIDGGRTRHRRRSPAAGSPAAESPAAVTGGVTGGGVGDVGGATPLSWIATAGAGPETQGRRVVVLRAERQADLVGDVGRLRRCPSR